jgi:hypothetical protein
VGRAQAQRKPNVVGGRGMATVGVALGVVNVLLWTFLLVYYLSQDA